MFGVTSADFQQITIQGELIYRIGEPAKTAKLLNYTVDSKRLTYLSEDPQKLADRLVGMALIAAKAAVKKLPLKAAIASSDEVAAQMYQTLAADAMIAALGVEVLGVSITAIKPSPETTKALEAETREDILKQSDEAIFKRRNYAVEQERMIRESELNTEIAVENKNREIQQTKMNTVLLKARKELEIEAERLTFAIQQEEKNRELVDLKARNEKIEADVKSYALSEIMKVYEKINPETLKALTAAGLDSRHIMAQAFLGLAEQAEKIGNLNITPDLLTAIVKGK
jgi:regulator of protease activity HflC (stomatin/prohibitin superfamily)